MTAHPQLIALIDQARERANLTSDRQLDDALGQTPQVSRWRKGFTIPNKDAAVLLAEMAGRDPEEVVNLLGFIEAERASQPRAAAVYRGILSRMAVTIALPLAIVLSPENAHASASHAEVGTASECILWKESDGPQGSEIPRIWAKPDLHPLSTVRDVPRKHIPDFLNHEIRGRRKYRLTKNPSRAQHDRATYRPWSCAARRSRRCAGLTS